MGLDAGLKRCFTRLRNERESDMIAKLIRALFRPRITTPSQQAHAEIERRQRANREAPILAACRANRLSPGQTRRVLTAFHANVAPLGLFAARQGACDLAADIARKAGEPATQTGEMPPWA